MDTYNSSNQSMVLRYIDQMLMEEDLDEQTQLLQESLDFQSKERSFYELLGQKYPPDSNEADDDSNDHKSTDYDAHFREGVDVANKFLPSGSENNDSHEKVPSNDVPVDEFDKILLYTVGEPEKKFEAYRTYLKTAQIVHAQHIVHATKCDKTEVIDLKSLLFNCAQFISACDRHSANKYLKQIRQHSSPYGNGSQRLAHYFANGLEARLSGTGTHMHRAIVRRQTITHDYLRAYYTFLASSPFGTVSNLIANKSIAAKSGKSGRVHVIDLGILHGFQWPSFMKSLSEREGGPPKLRITGIEFLQPGAERNRETGRRLAHYAETFGMPFEYNAISRDCGSIKIEDFRIEEGEFLAVNCLYRGQAIPDEAGLEESSRTKVLKMIREMNPDMFVHDIVNADYGDPLFAFRFRKAYFHFSNAYDMVETTIPRETPERMVIEREFLGREAMNVIACEGVERVERVETYKHWQARHLNAGFMQIPFERKLVESAMHRVKKLYHREFLIDEVKKWVLMGWKGRITHAISCWQPAIS